MTACKSNLKNIGTALEMHSTDHEGHYPGDVDAVVPEYLEQLPSCPAAGTVTYSYFSGVDAPLNTEGYEDYYFLECQGEHHGGVSLPANYPQYNSVMGLIER